MASTRPFAVTNQPGLHTPSGAQTLPPLTSSGRGPGSGPGGGTLTSPAWPLPASTLRMTLLSFEREGMHTMRDHGTDVRFEPCGAWEPGSDPGAGACAGCGWLEEDHWLADLERQRVNA